MIQKHRHEHTHEERTLGKKTIPPITHIHSHPHLLGSADPINNHHELYRASGEDSEMHIMELSGVAGTDLIGHASWETAKS